MPYEIKKRLIIIAFIALAFASSMARPVELSATDTMHELLASPTYTVEEKVALYFADIPVMQEIARCESHYRQTTMDGSVLRGEKVSADVGVFQINEYYHKAQAEKLGLDLHALEGNMIYARYLYEKEGTTPWNASAKCWKKGAK